MTATILQGDCLSVLPTLQPGSMDCVVSSPPYWQLRDYAVCPCVQNRKKRPSCTNCDDNGKVPVVRDNQLGMEATIEEYIANQVRVWRLVREAMAPHAVAFCNIGDSYSGGTTGRNDAARRNNHGVFGEGEYRERHGGGGSTSRPPAQGIPAGNLMLVPQRLALALQSDGWICRSVICWTKPSAMPASLAGWRWMQHRVKVKEGGRGGNGSARMLEKGNREKQSGGIVNASQAQWAPCPGCAKCLPTNGLVLRRGSWRPTSSWEPILLLAKSAEYFCDGEAVKQKASPNKPWSAKSNGGRKALIIRQDGNWEGLGKPADDAGANLRDVFRTRLADMTKEELIALIEDMDDGNCRDVQSWASESLKERHYAAFPTALVELCLRAGTSARGYCVHCGAPWCRVVEKGGYSKADRPSARKGGEDDPHYQGSAMSCVGGGHWPTTTLRWRQTCTCPPHEPRPARVLDPFAGSGRVGIQAVRLGLDFTGIELSPAYCALAERKLSESSPLFADARIEDAEDRYQPADLFGEDAP